MRTIFLLPLALAIGLATPNDAAAQAPRYQGGVSVASTEGYARGVRAGEEDQRRGRPFNVSNDNDYRRGDAGYR
jgi:hypothetical protein